MARTSCSAASTVRRRPTSATRANKTTLPRTPVSRDAPFLYVEKKRFKVFVPGARRHVRGLDWGTRARDGRSLPLQAFHVAKPGDSAQTLNRALAAGKHLLLTPGVYSLDEPLRIKRPGHVSSWAWGTRR